MFKIDPNTLYSKQDLAQEPDGVTDVDRFLGRINPKSVIMGTYLDADLLDALKRTPDYREAAHTSVGEREIRANRNANWWVKRPEFREGGGNSRWMS